jgi:hypothetical protein
MRLSVFVALFSATSFLACGSSGSDDDLSGPSPSAGGGSAVAGGAGTGGSAVAGGAGSGGAAAGQAGSGGGESGGTGGTTAGGAAGSSGGAAGSSGTGGTDPGGVKYRIHLAASTAPFTHSDGLAGETPLAHSSGIRSFQLFKDASDTSPLTVFDLGDGFVEAGYNDGDDTVLAAVDPATLTAGTYTLGRVVHTHVRYRINATMHQGALPIPGEFDNVQVLSDHTTLDGKTYEHGHFDYAFKVAGMSFPLSGENAPEPEYTGSGGFSIKLEAGQWAYYFPVNIPVDPTLGKDVDTYLRVNMFESFRWQDDPTGVGYLPGVFDATPTGSETVVRFGANSFAVDFQIAP